MLFFATLSVARKKGLIGQCYSVTIFLDDLLLYDLFCIFFTLHNPYPANRISINPMLSRPLKRILNGNMRIRGSWLDAITWCMDFDLYRQTCNLRIQREKRNEVFFRVQCICISFSLSDFLLLFYSLSGGRCISLKCRTLSMLYTFYASFMYTIYATQTVVPIDNR